MSKVTFKAGTMLNPLPVVMVTCGEGEQANIITIAWTGIINSEPPMTYISVRKSRYSHGLISKGGEFVINLVTEELAFQADYCGVKSGRDVNKFQEQKLTPCAAEHVKCPMIAESPVNIECRVQQVMELPSHDMFIADIIAVHADEKLMDDKGRLRLDQAKLTAYNHGEYFGLKPEPFGRFGYSVMKPKTKKRIEKESRSSKGRRSVKAVSTKENRNREKTR